MHFVDMILNKNLCFICIDKRDFIFLLQSDLDFVNNLNLLT